MALSHSLLIIQNAEEATIFRVPIICAEVQAILQTNPIVFILASSHWFPEMVLEPDAFMSLCGMSCYRNWPDQVRYDI